MKIYPEQIKVGDRVSFEGSVSEIRHMEAVVQLDGGNGTLKVPFPHGFNYATITRPERPERPERPLEESK